jgi:hypothetical protein
MFSIAAIIAVPSRARFVNVFGFMALVFDETQIVVPNLAWLRAGQFAPFVPGTTTLSAISGAPPGNPGYHRVIVPTNATHLAIGSSVRDLPTPPQCTITWELEL